MKTPSPYLTDYEQYQREFAAACVAAVEHRDVVSPPTDHPDVKMAKADGYRCGVGLREFLEGIQK